MGMLASKAGLRLAENSTKSLESARQTQMILLTLKVIRSYYQTWRGLLSSNEIFSIEHLDELSEIMIST